MFSRRAFIILALIISTLIVYAPVRHFPFINYDDFDYITTNPNLDAGLNQQSIVWAFTTYYAANYHPLTWASLLLDCTLFGRSAQAIHVENVLWHIAGAILLFLVLETATGQTWAAAFVAGVFALHPTHVESVAWASERKDVLSTFFILAALLCYLHYARSKTSAKRWFYASVFVLYSLSLLSKSMGVTFPLLLLLLDYWPLARWRSRWIIAEKIPLMILALLASVKTYEAQQSIVANLHSIPVGVRAQNAVLSYARYLAHFFWPADLSVLYPYRFHPSSGEVSVVALLLLGITSVCIRQITRRKYLIVGWLWFLGTLVPVIGVVQVGAQSMADRYLYFPSIGLTIIVAWAAGEMLHRTGAKAMAGLAIGTLLALGVVCRHQVMFWRDRDALFAHASLVMNGDVVAEVRLGFEAAQHGDSATARRHYEQAMKLDPANYAAEFDMGNLLAKDQPQLAAEYYSHAVADDPDPVDAQVILAKSLFQMNDRAGAFAHFHMAEQLDPDAYEPHYNLGQMLLIANHFSEAGQEFSIALKCRPNDPGALRGLATATSRGMQK